MQSELKKIHVPVRWQPKQERLWDLIEHTPTPVIGYGGARGGSKSHGLRMAQVSRRLLYDNTNGLLFRKTYNDLYENHILPLFTKYPFMRDWYNKSEKILTYPNGSWTRFGYAEHHDDIYEFFGKAYTDIMVDEATDLEQDQLEFLRTCNRDTSGTGIIPKFVLGMNPGRIGHSYCKRIFIDKRYDGNERPEDYTFLQAFGWDNVEWVRKALWEDHETVAEYYSWSEEKRFAYFITRSDYGKILNALPENERKAHLLGDWDTFAGMFFPDFSRKHVIKPFEIPHEWELVGSLDPGYSSACSFGLQARDYDGRVYRIGTYYETNRNPEQNAEGVKAFIQGNKHTRGRWPSVIVSGKDAWAKRDRYAVIASLKTFAEVFADAGIYLEQATVDRHQGWWTLKTLMPDRFRVFEGFNTPLVDQLTAVVFDDIDKEDLIGRGNNPNVEDHALDDLRYGTMAIYKPTKPPEQKGWEELWAEEARQSQGWKVGMG
jgi:phage terminase large subunit